MNDYPPRSLAARAIILAAGTSERIGKQKLLMEFRGRTLIEYAIDAASRWNPIVVAGAEVALHLEDRPGLVLLRNDEPKRGMAHSLALADRFLPAEASMIVLLGDKPLMTPASIETILRSARDADVVYPVYAGEPGHPVWLSRRARRRIATLPPGDTLRLLRADSHLTARIVVTNDPGATFDVDTLTAFHQMDGKTEYGRARTS